MGDLVKPIGQWIAGNIPLSVGIGLFLFCLFFEISKIKVYPLKWLWKAISWPFRKIDEQRTNSFKNLIVSLQADIDGKLTNMTTSFDTKLTSLTTSFDSKLTEVSTSQTNNCAAVKACFADLEKRFDKLDEQQQETDERLDKLAASRIKNHVLNFARQCRKGELHSREDYRNLFEECKIYEALVEKYQLMDEKHKKDWENNVFKHDFAYIEHTYDECNINNSFLGG